MVLSEYSVIQTGSVDSMNERKKYIGSFRNFDIKKTGKDKLNTEEMQEGNAEETREEKEKLGRTLLTEGLRIEGWN